jgi:hypothetical protein
LPAPDETETDAEYAVEIRGGKLRDKTRPDGSKRGKKQGMRDPQILIVTSDEPLNGYELDDPQRVEWEPNQRHPEAVLIGVRGEETYVIFIELKATFDESKGKHGKLTDASEQIQGAIDHFHPYGGMAGKPVDGDEHHERWRSGEEELPIKVVKKHKVIGLAFVRRTGDRGQMPRPKLEILNGSEVIRAFVPFHGASRNKLEITFSRLLSYVE